jgi:methyl-accepting chemotaxis protein
MVNMETGMRGFAVSGRDVFLEPFARGRTEVPQFLARAKALTADNPVQQDRIARLERNMQAFIAIADELFARRRAAGADLAGFSSYFAQGRDKAAMDAFRSGIAELQGEESHLLEQRREAARATGETAQRVLQFGGLLLVLSIVGAGAWLSANLLRLLGGEPAYACEVVQRLAEGKLSEPVHVAYPGTASLLGAMHEMQQRLAATVLDIRQSSRQVAASAGEIASGNQALSGRTESQASALEETASSMEELTSTVEQNSANAASANQLAADAARVARNGGAAVDDVVSTMDGIHASASKIVDIIAVIDGIAFQTNILALNAAVEAARAGDLGRGFAVVASEVRSLAQRSANAAKEIKELIDDSVARVDEGNRRVGEAGATMREVVASVEKVARIVNEISSASAEQASGIAQVGQAVLQMDEMTQQNAALVEEAAASALALDGQAAELERLVARFEVAEAPAAAGPVRTRAVALRPAFA